MVSIYEKMKVGRKQLDDNASKIEGCMPTRKGRVHILHGTCGYHDVCYLDLGRANAALSPGEKPII